MSKGVREITYALPDRTPLRKYVVARKAGEIQLDVLYPSGPARPRRLVLQRGPAIDESGNDLDREAGEANLISVSDELGNDETFLALGHRGGGSLYSPVWDGVGNAIYYSYTNFSIDDRYRGDYGVFHYDLDGKKRTRVWGAPKYQVNPESIALSPEGTAIVASMQGSSVIVIHDIRSGAARAEELIRSESCSPRRSGGSAHRSAGRPAFSSIYPSTTRRRRTTRGGS